MEKIFKFCCDKPEVLLTGSEIKIGANFSGFVLFTLSPTLRDFYPVINRTSFMTAAFTMELRSVPKRG